MKKTDLADRLARGCGISRAEAADQLDRIVTDIVRSLRRGESATLPGLGTIQPGKSAKARFQPSGKSRSGEAQKRK